MSSNIPRFIRDAAVLCLLMFLAVFQQPCSLAPVDVDGLYPGERSDLLKLRDSSNSSSNLHRRWTGPPCIGDESRWVGVGCSNSHVVQLVLDGIQLRGSLPENFLQSVTFLTRLSLQNNSISGALPALSGLLHLEDVSLSQNGFSGSIPSEYVKLPKLTKLELQGNVLTGGVLPFNQQTLVFFNVSSNHLAGPIPDTQVLRYFPKSSFDHNPGLCGIPVGLPCPAPPPIITPPPPPSPSTVSPPQPIPTPKRERSHRVRNIVLIAASAALVPFFIMAFFLCYYKKAVRKNEETKEQHAGGSVDFTQTRTLHSHSGDDPERVVELEFFDKEAVVFDLDDLLRASAEILGKGNLGTTYKAVLELGSVVSVKRLMNMNGLSKKEFVQQMQLLGNLKHENLMEIISFYYSKEEKLVIYEFVPDGNLFDLLHGFRGGGRVPLDWAARISIIKDIAKGLNFLHQFLSSQRVPHANLKSSNVLIHRDGPNYRAKLIDFGFWPLLPNRKLSEVLSVGKTPEFLQLKKMTHKADIYCFGIVILEIVTGKIPGKISPANDETFDDLSDWVRMVVNNDWSTEILDTEISGDKDGQDEMLKLTEIALECTDEMAEKRPKIGEVLRRIEEIEQRNANVRMGRAS
ncbi:probable leucine-rich repeat receptor-like protein kinase At1g68400 [Punica granatum]|uniref:Probable leucine-rich repeat receptor-like protein kinase At1g68400 n=1 Tax=Punica granatum TaxID=22663 RepID=A0A218VQW4_PUNGR|nr:probable leucine-rich repeat receptor-like protein kinase At1g68400 [Punica granatum]OWM62699.1 hypothetical protein CDL15_Pgr019993 [Punica granatum]